MSFSKRTIVGFQANHFCRIVTEFGTAKACWFWRCMLHGLALFAWWCFQPWHGWSSGTALLPWLYTYISTTYLMTTTLGQFFGGGVGIPNFHQVIVFVSISIWLNDIEPTDSCRLDLYFASTIRVIGALVLMLGMNLGELPLSKKNAWVFWTYYVLRSNFSNDRS